MQHSAVLRADDTFQETGKGDLRQSASVFAIAFLIGGWFFIRNAVIHDGDLLGMRTSNESASLYAADEYKPENRQTPASEGWSFQQTYLQTPEGRTSNWLFSTVSSFIGSFSYMTVHLPMVLYLLYGALMAFGFLVFLFLAMVPHWLRKKPQLLLFVMLLLACLITLFMDMYNTYFSDYQSQGRYLMPALVPLMIWIDDGYSSLTAQTSRRVEARLLPSDTPAWNDLAGTVPHQLHRISDSGLCCG
ncbi:MAG: hypothetical protein V8R97_08880 [Fusicatenibacter saccharivorans]